ncbi:hypothetical protein M2138_000818 [Dysgonomonadaceae bacterium PH5-43]|nr:hypothetical protein [Dysgonomonadaceae bacterium PH5-43]
MKTISQAKGVIFEIEKTVSLSKKVVDYSKVTFKSWITSCFNTMFLKRYKAYLICNSEVYKDKVLYKLEPITIK